MKNWQDMVGKTIEAVDDTTADNVVVLKFSDKTSAFVDTEAIGFGLYRPTVSDSINYCEQAHR